MSRSIYRFSGLYWIIVAILFPVFIYLLHAQKYNSSEIVKAKVIRGLEGRLGKFRTIVYYYPQYELWYNDSLYYSATEGFGIRDFPVGSVVKVYFKKGDPQHSSIYTFSSFWLKHVELMYYIMIAGFLFALPKLIKTFIYDMKHINE